MAVKSIVRKTVATSDLFPEGLNRAILVEVEEHDTPNNSSIRLTFANGDLEHKEDLWDSDKAQARKTMITRRLGLLDENGPEEQEVLYDNAVGVEFVIDVKHELNQNEQKISKLTYAGVWPLNHEDKKVRAYLNTAEGKKSATAGERSAPSSGSGNESNDLDDI